MLSEEIIIQTDGNGKKKEKYLKKEKIGSGGFAKCYLFLNTRTNEKFAAKVIDAKQSHDKSSRSKILQEIEIHKELSHQNIVRFDDMFEFEGKIYIIMELCQNNSLKEFIKNRVRITEFEAKCYLHQIIEGLEYLHGKSIVHRDIKLGNIFLNFKMEIKIGDFGLSSKLKSPKQRKFTTCGTPNYIAPEILRETGHSFEADVWAIGIILFAMLTGKPPFESDSVETTYKKIKTGLYDFPKQIPLSSEVKALIKGILDPNPKTRLTLSEIKSSQFLSKELQKIPPLMPSYTISIPPQSKYLKQFVSERSMKLQIYPKKLVVHKKITDYSNGDTLGKFEKLSRVLSADKKFITKLNEESLGKEVSSLNRGRYIKALRIKSLSKDFKSSAGSSSRKLQIMEVMPKTQRRETLKYEQDVTEIICYYDMSQKYGIGYLLSNGNYGVVFNDHSSLTKIWQCHRPNTPSSRRESEKKSSGDENIGKNYAYYSEGKLKFCERIEAHLSKKGEILKICEKKLSNYRQNHILIPYYSQVYGKRWIKLKNCFAIKMSNSIIQFFWDSDSITLRGYRWIKWRINDEEGEGALNQKNLPLGILERVDEVKNFLIKESTKKKKNKLSVQD